MEYKFVVTGFWVVILVLLALLSHRVDSEPTQDKQALLAFISQIPHANRLQWNASDSACNWVGVVCGSNRSFVFSLRLLVAVLVGHIPANTIGNLAQLRILSLRCLQTASQVISALCAVVAVDTTVMTSVGLKLDPSKLQVSIEYGLCEMLNREAIRPNVAPKDGYGFSSINYFLSHKSHQTCLHH